MASSFVPYSHRRPAVQPSKGVTDYLRSHDRFGALMPTVTRLAALQRACTTALPDLFAACSVLRFDTEGMVIAAPSAAFAARLRQVQPKLKAFLQSQGWQVNAMRIKVQVGNIVEQSTKEKQLALPPSAVTAFATLANTLENHPRNTELKSALEAMVTRHARRP